MKEFDAIVIGTGQAGVPLAKKLAQAGWKVAIIEKRFVGGTCVNDGCTPTKAMVASARMAYMAGRGHEFGVEIPSYQVNFKKIIARKSALVKSSREGTTAGIEKTKNLTLVFGEAKFENDHTIIVNGNDGSLESYTAKHIFINTGDSPVITDIEGIKDIDYLTSTSIMELEELPEHLLIIGSGYIGLEFGQMFKRFGSKVTLLEHSDRLLPKEDDDVCEAVSEILKEDGINVLLEAKAVKVEKLGDNHIRVTMEQDGKTTTHTCSHILLASGRKPQTEFLGLETTAIECDDQGHIKVDEFLETKVKNVYALGDVKGGPAFTHIAYNDYIIVANNLLEGGKMSIKDRLVPYCMFIDPQLGRVGMTETEAIEQKLDYIAAKIPMKYVARAEENGETRGFMKAIVDKKTQQILGVTILGDQGGEIMTILQLAMVGKITYMQIKDMVFAHPLYAESLNNLFMSIA